MKASESLQNDESAAAENALRRAVDTTPAFIHTARPDGYLDYFNRLSILEGGAVKFSVNIKMRGEKARIDFDLSPSVGKKIRNYVWVLGRTGSNVAGRWVEREGR
jgi:hypothetical protein